jgi:hypothetical protein
MDGSASPPPLPPAPVPLALSVSPLSRRDTVTTGATSADPAAVTVTLSGDNSSTTPWSALARHSWTQLTNAAGTGSGTLQWTRNPSGLASGIYVDTITVSASTLTSPVIDSLVVLSPSAPPPPPPPSPLTEAVSPASRYRSAKVGTSLLTDSAQALLTGTGADLTAWTATNLKPWLTLSAAAGVGSGTLRWSRNLTGLAAGTYVDTITVVALGAIGSPSTVIDTLVVTAKGKRTSRSTSTGASADDGVSLRVDSAYVDVDAGTAWSAGTTAPWVTLLGGSGTGPGYLRWTRNLTGMSFGIHEDSIVVSSGTGVAREVELVVTETIVAGADQVAASVAASALFGPSALSELQQRMLDLLGNANGRYDVGDLLAYLDRTGYTLTAPMMARVMALPQPPPSRRQPQR